MTLNETKCASAQLKYAAALKDVASTAKQVALARACCFVWRKNGYWKTNQDGKIIITSFTSLKDRHSLINQSNAPCYCEEDSSPPPDLTWIKISWCIKAEAIKIKVTEMLYPVSPEETLSLFHISNIWKGAAHWRRLDKPSVSHTQNRPVWFFFYSNW